MVKLNHSNRAWLTGFTPQIFATFTDFILGDKVAKFSTKTTNGRHPLTYEMMDGSTIGGGSKVRMQYQVECKCITNRYGQQWDNELSKQADRFVQGLI